MDYDDDEPTTVEPDGDQLTLEPLKLPSGGSVSFHDPENLNGKDVRWLRKALDAAGGGSATNQLYERAMVLLIEAWDIPYRPGMRIPRHDKSNNKAESVERLRARDLRAIERHLSPLLKKITRGADPDGDEDNDPS